MGHGIFAIKHVGQRTDPDMRQIDDSLPLNHRTNPSLRSRVSPESTETFSSFSHHHGPRFLR
jgi:hypothetical protein